jgi:hypothetical protein
MRFRPVVDLTDRLALVGGKCGDIHQRRDLLLARRPDDRASIGISIYHDRPLDPLKRLIEHLHVARKEVIGSRAATAFTPSDRWALSPSSSSIHRPSHRAPAPLEHGAR